MAVESQHSTTTAEGNVPITLLKISIPRTGLTDGRTVIDDAYRIGGLYFSVLITIILQPAILSSDTW